MLVRFIILFVSLFPFLGNAQFRLYVETRDMEDSSFISNVPVTLGEISGVTYPFDLRFSNLDVELLDDTLFIEYPGYKFEVLPLSAHNYKLTGTKLHLKVYAQPWIDKQLNLDVAISKSKKIKNDSVQLSSDFGSMTNTVVSFEPMNQSSKNKRANTDPFKIAYNDLENGHFVLKSDVDVTRIPFKKQDWIQRTYLQGNKEIQTTERELQLLKTYFQSLEKAKLEKKKVEQEYQQKLDRLKSDNEKLRLELTPVNDLQISNATDGDSDLVIPPPTFSSERHFIYREAAPIQGFDEYKSGLEAAIVRMNTQYSGNITIKISVDKNGRVQSHLLHAGEDKSEIVKKIHYYLRNQPWKPQVWRSIEIDTELILSINIGVSK